MEQGHQTGDRGGIDNAAAGLLPNHLRDFGLQTTKDVSEVHGEQLGPLLCLDI